jgi:hypothetical protein
MDHDEPFTGTVKRAVLTTDLPDHHLKAGDIGVVVMIHGDHEGYELEIFGADGHTVDVVTVEANQVRPISRHDVLHVRAMPEQAR